MGLRIPTLSYAPAVQAEELERRTENPGRHNPELLRE